MLPVDCPQLVRFSTHSHYRTIQQDPCIPYYLQISSPLGCMLSTTPSSGSGCVAPLYIYCPSAPVPFSSYSVYQRETVLSYFQLFIRTFQPSSPLHFVILHIEIPSSHINTLYTMGSLGDLDIDASPVQRSKEENQER